MITCCPRRNRFRCSHNRREFAWVSSRSLFRKASSRICLSNSIELQRIKSRSCLATSTIARLRMAIRKIPSRNYVDSHGRIQRLNHAWYSLRDKSKRRNSLINFKIRKKSKSSLKPLCKSLRQDILDFKTSESFPLSMSRESESERKSACKQR